MNKIYYGNLKNYKNLEKKISIKKLKGALKEILKDYNQYLNFKAYKNEILAQYYNTESENYEVSKWETLSGNPELINISDICYNRYLKKL